MLEKAIDQMAGTHGDEDLISVDDEGLEEVGRAGKGSRSYAFTAAASLILAAYCNRSLTGMTEQWGDINTTCHSTVLLTLFLGLHTNNDIIISTYTGLGFLGAFFVWGFLNLGGSSSAGKRAKGLWGTVVAFALVVTCLQAIVQLLYAIGHADWAMKARFKMHLPPVFTSLQGLKAGILPTASD